MLARIILVVIIEISRSFAIFPGIHLITGLDTSISKYPWMLSLRNGTGHHVCGGALITARPNVTRSDVGITAAHCFRAYILGFRRLNNFVIAGSTINNFNNTGGEKRRIIEVENNGFFPGDDIAVIKFDSPFEFTDRIKPVELPKQGRNVPRDASCAVTGWGLFQNHALQELPVSLRACNSRKFEYGNSFCAAGDTGSICSGDSGSPMVCQDENGHQVQEGIVSYSDPSCGDFPATYTRVSFYTDWIHQTVNTVTSISA